VLTRLQNPDWEERWRGKKGILSYKGRRNLPRKTRRAFYSESRSDRKSCQGGAQSLEGGRPRQQIHEKCSESDDFLTRA